MSAAKDKIESLPGAPAFSSDQYSGFLHITPTKSIHYIYYESEKNPVTDSIIFWTNGGPGCSGLLGLFTELGPWRPLYNGTLIRNPASWTSLASLVFLEQPVGVGFSKTSDKSELELNDYMAARDNLLTIKEFLKRFPERINNTMYIASESYGGHYIPQLTIALLADKELSNRFEGFLVGNPFVSYGSGDIAFIQTLWGLQLIDYPLCVDALNFPICSAEYSLTAADSRYRKIISHSSQGKALRKLLTTAIRRREIKNITKSVNHVEVANNKIEPSKRDIGSTECSIDDGGGGGIDSSGNYEDNFSAFQLNDIKLLSESAQEVKSKVHDVNKNFLPTLIREQTEGAWRAPAVTHLGLDYHPCTEEYTVAYLNDPAVQYALHIIDSPTSAVVDWSTCSDIVSWNPLDVNADTTKLYSDIYHKVTNQRKNGERSKDFRMLIFSGDADGVCSTIGTQHWIYSVTEKERNTASSVLDELIPATATSASTHSSLLSPQSLPSPSSSSYFSSSQNRDSKSTTSSPISLWQPWVIVNGDSDIILETGAVRGRPQGGYLTQFEGSFSFATVHHAGHEVPGFQPIAALSLLSGFLDGSIFLSTTTTTSSSLGVGGSGTFFRPSDVWTSIFISLGISGLMIVCCFMYIRETKLRLGSSGPPVSMIETEIDMSEDEGRVGPAARVSASPRIIFSPGSKYVPMSTDDD